jgi:CheY-like chemotaxis protein
MSLLHQPTRHLSILIVDDEDAFRMVMKDVLAAEGFTVIPCASGEEAVELLQRATYDVVVLDYKMGEMSGLNVLQWMFEQKMQTPVVMLTAAGTEYVAVEAMKLGAYDYIRKEQVDINHLPLILHGVHERYLFRLEKERHETSERERTKSLIAIETFYKTLVSLSHLMKNALGNAATKVEEHRAAASKYVRPEGYEAFRTSLNGIGKQHESIAAIAQSMVCAADLLRGNYTASEHPANEGVQEALKVLQEKIPFPVQGKKRE